MDQRVDLRIRNIVAANVVAACVVADRDVDGVALDDGAIRCANKGEMGSSEHVIALLGVCRNVYGRGDVADDIGLVCSA